MAVELTYAARFAKLAEEARVLVQKTEVAYSVACVSLGVTDARRALLAANSPVEVLRMGFARAVAVDMVTRMKLELVRASHTLAYAEQHHCFSLLDERRVALPVLRTDADLAQKRAHLSNLALLAPNSPTKEKEFFSGLKGVEVDDSARIGDSLAVWQAGRVGDLIVTPMRISKVMTQGYVVDNAAFLVYEATGIIRSESNSFTLPVVKGRKLAALLLRYDSKNQVATLLPAPIIQHFLKDVADGRYDGFPSLGIEFQVTQDEQFRDYLLAVDLGLQLRGPDHAGVDHMGLLAQVGQQLALELDGVDQGALALVGGFGIDLLAGQRVPAARFRETPHQRLGGGVEEQGLQLRAAITQGLQVRRHQGQRLRAAHVHRDGHAPRAEALLQVDEGQQQLRRQVVDAVVAGVFERAQRHRLARTGHAGQEHQLQAHRDAPSISLAWASVVPERRSPPSMRATSATRCSPLTGVTLQRIVGVGAVLVSIQTVPARACAATCSATASNAWSCGNEENTHGAWPRSAATSVDTGSPASRASCSRTPSRSVTHNA